MKNILILALAFVVLLGGYPVVAQQINNDDVYVVQPGDSAWRVAGMVMDDPTLWEEVVKKNPFLKEKGRISRDPKTGWVMVMMHPGEKLYGLRELGIIDTPGGSTFLPLEVITARRSKADLERLTWLLLSLILLFLLIFWYVFLRSRRDPVSSGPAIVPGGVAPENAPARFQEMAAQLNNRRTGTELSAQNFQIIDSHAGRIWGILNVRYADQQEIPRRLNGDRAYRAQVRFPNGKTEMLYMLQGCGNDLRYGGISRYIPGPDFKFEADPEPVAPPPTVPTQPIVAQPVVPQGPMVVAGIQPTGEFVREKDAPSIPVSPEMVSPGKPKVLRSFVELPAQSGKPAAFVFTGGVTGFEELEDGTITVRFRNNK